MVKLQSPRQKIIFKVRLIKVAPYSFTIAGAQRTKFQVICARSKENVSVFRYFIASTLAQNAKLTINFLAFPSVKFRKTWQTGSKCFTLVGARRSSFFREIYKTSFFAAIIDINLQISKTCL